MLSEAIDNADGLTIALKGVSVVPPLVNSTLYVPFLSFTKPKGNDPSELTFPENVSTNVPSL